MVREEFFDFNPFNMCAANNVGKEFFRYYGRIFPLRVVYTKLTKTLN